MFEYTCPKCQNASTTTTPPNGAVTPCAACGQRLCVVLDPTALPEEAPRGWGTPLLAASSGLSGLVVAAGIMLMWLLVGRGLVAGGKAVAANDPAKKQVAEVGSGAPETHNEPINDAQKKNPADDAQKKNPTDDIQKKNPTDDTQKKNPTDDTQKKNPTDDTQKKNPTDDIQKKNPTDDTQKKNPTDDPSPPPPPPSVEPSIPPPLDPDELKPTVIATPPVDPDMLAEGPAAIVVNLERPDKIVVAERGSLCCLKKNALWYRQDENWKLIKIDGKEGRVKSVELNGGKDRWDWDSQQGLFVGPAKPVETIDLTPDSALGADETAFLFSAIEQLQKDLESSAMDDLGVIEETARKYRSLAGADHPKLADLCLGVLDLVQRRKERDDRIATSLVTLQEDRKQAIADFHRAEVANFVSGFKDVDADSSDELILSLLFAGARVQAGHLVVEQWTRGRLEQLSVKAKADIDEALKDYEQDADAWRKQLCEVGHDDFGRPTFEEVEKQRGLFATLRSNNDRGGVAKFYVETADQEKMNPFRISERCLAAAQVPVAKDKRRQKSENLLRLAKECARAVRLVPPERVFDRPRLTILYRAALLACEAADAELEGESWVGAYSPAAAYAVRLIDVFNGYSRFFELSGELRERRAWALAQCGRPDEAFDQAVAVKDLRKDQPEFGVKLARLYCRRGGTADAKANAKEAMRWLDIAVRSAGFVDILELKRNPDLGPVRGLQSMAFNGLTEVRADGKPLTPVPMAFSQPPPTTDFEVTNNSAFALTNVTVKVDVSIVTNGGRNAKPKTLTTPEVFARIEPGQTVVVADIFKDLAPGWVYSKRYSVECDQNRK